jgi:hypothetical protein
MEAVSISETSFYSNETDGANPRRLSPSNHTKLVICNGIYNITPENRMLHFKLRLT